MRKYPRQREIREIFDYEKETGFFYWKKEYGARCKVGTRAGSKSSKGWMVGINHQQYSLSRIAWIYEYGSLEKGEYITHINGNKHDNSIKNLKKISMRDCSLKRKNITNIMKTKQKKPRFAVSIIRDGVRKGYKSFLTKKEAEIYVKELRKKYDKD